MKTEGADTPHACLVTSDTSATLCKAVLSLVCLHGCTRFGFAVVTSSHQLGPQPLGHKGPLVLGTWSVSALQLCLPLHSHPEESTQEVDKEQYAILCSTVKSVFCKGPE